MFTSSTLRVTKNMLFLSKQLPNPNYDNQKIPKIIENKNKITKINVNNSLPNIINNLRVKEKNEEKNNNFDSNTSKKIFLKYKITNNTNNITNNDNDTSIYNNETQKNILIKTDLLTPINKSTNKLSIKSDLDKTNNYELINNTPKYKINQEKNGIINKEKTSLKYAQGLSVGNLYSDYNSEIKKNYRINNLYKSQKKRIEFLPNIYRNRANNSVNKRYNYNRINK